VVERFRRTVKATPQAIKASLRDLIRQAGEEVGSNGRGKGGLLGYIKHLSIDEPGLYVQLLTKTMPTQAEINSTTALTIEPRGADALDELTREVVGVAQRLRAGNPQLRLVMQSDPDYEAFLKWKAERAAGLTIPARLPAPTQQPVTRTDPRSLNGETVTLRPIYRDSQGVDHFEADPPTPPVNRPPSNVMKW
jgi:hypothetical protein